MAGSQIGHSALWSGSLPESNLMFSTQIFSQSIYTLFSNIANRQRERQTNKCDWKHNFPCQGDNNRYIILCATLDSIWFDKSD